MLERVLIGVAGALVLFLAFVATRRSAYHVERKTEIAAPPDAVFRVLDDLQRFARVVVFFGSPLGEDDPDMVKTFEGRSFVWKGKKGGEGKVTIEESVAGNKVVMRLEWVKPMASVGTLTLALAKTKVGTSVTWSMDGNHNFLGKLMGVFLNMDRMLGGDVEKGLARLSEILIDAHPS